MHNFMEVGMSIIIPYLRDASLCVLMGKGFQLERCGSLQNERCAANNLHYDFWLCLSLCYYYNIGAYDMSKLEKPQITISGRLSRLMLVFTLFTAPALWDFLLEHLGVSWSIPQILGLSGFMLLLGCILSAVIEKDKQSKKAEGNGSK